MKCRLKNINSLTGNVDIIDGFYYHSNMDLNKNIYLLSEYNGENFRLKYFCNNNLLYDKIEELELYINNYGKL